MKSGNLLSSNSDAPQGRSPGALRAVLLVLATALVIGALVAATVGPSGLDGPAPAARGNGQASEAGPMDLGGIPDLELDLGTVMFSTNVAGPITIQADVYNIGNDTATGYYLAFYDGDPSSGGTQISQPALASIAAGGHALSSAAWSAAAGAHQLYLRFENADPNDPTANNQVSRAFYVLTQVTAVAGGDRATDPDVNVTFDGSASSSFGSSITDYTWDFGDGEYGYGSSVTHKWSNAGSTTLTYTVKLTVKDASSRTAVDTATVYVNKASATKPTANAGTAPSGKTLATLGFNGSSSSGNITSYLWDFGDGSSGSGVSPSHVYYDEGTYKVSLAVINNYSAVDTAIISVVVSNQPPVVTPIGNIQTDLNTPVTLLALAYDVDGYISSYSWRFGDGGSSTSRNPSHAWTSDGPHTMSLNVTDDDGAIASLTFYVNVTNVPPVAKFSSPASSREGDRVNVDASASTEPGNDIVSYEWDWEGDGTWDNSTTTPTFSHTYYRPGFYNITLRVKDGEGTTNTTRKPITISNVAPTARATVAPNPAIEGQEVTLNATTSTEPGMNITEYSWDWTMDNIYEVNTTNPVLLYTFWKPTSATQYGRLRVRDEDNTTGLAYFSYRINNAPPLVMESNNTVLEDQEVSIHVVVEEPGDNFKDFRWDFNNDGNTDKVTTVPYVNFTFWDSGRFTIWCNVTDADNTWGAGEVKIDVTDVAPVPRVADGFAVEGTPKAFAVDLLGNERNITRYSVDLNDDGVYEVNSTTQPIYLEFTKVNNSIRCTVRVTDRDGTDGTWLFKVAVSNTPPVLTAPAFAIGQEGDPIPITVGVYEPGMDMVSYGWDWEADGIVDDTTAIPTASHVFTEPGAKHILVTGTDVDLTSGSVDFRALITNVAPKADAGTPPLAKEGIPIALSAAGSFEPGGDIVSYEWDFDGDGMYDVETSKVEIQYAWEKPGTYSVGLRVTDEDGSFGLDRVPVQVEDVLPVAALEVTVNPEDEMSVLDASGSYDAGGLSGYVWAIVATNFNYTTTTEGPVLMFAFDRRVEYTITLAVLDDDTAGGTTSQVRVVVDMRQIKTNPPTVSWTLPVSPAEGEMATFTATAQDPFPTGPGLQQVFLFEWEFGDGARDTGATVVHSFAAKETDYVVQLTVTDEDDDKTVLTGNVTVRNLPPVIASIKPIEVKVGGRGTTNISATDLTAGAVTISLGEGSPKWVTVDGTKLVAKPKSGTVAGTYLVTVRVTDAMGAGTDTFVPITVGSEEGGLVAKPVSWGPFLAVVIIVLILFIIIALIIARRARASAPPPPPPSPREEEVPGGYPYEAEPVMVRHREPPRAAIEAERVRIEMEEEVAAAPAQPTAEELYGERARVAPAAMPPPPPPPPPAPAAEVGGFELEMEPEEAAPAPPPPPPAQEVKIWRPPAQAREKPVAVQQRAAPAPPPPPRERAAPKPAAGDSRYRMHAPAEGEKKRYRGAGPPK